MSIRTIRDRLEKLGLRVKMDDSEQSPGWKFAPVWPLSYPQKMDL